MNRLGLYDLRDAVIATESSHKNGMFSLTRNVTECQSLNELIKM